MQQLKYFCLFFLLLNTSFSFAQRAGFSATIGLNTFNPKSGDTLRVCKGGTIKYTNTVSNPSAVKWRYSNSTIGNFNGGLVSINYPDTGREFFTTQTVSFFGYADDSIKVIVVVSEKDPDLKADFLFSPIGTPCANINFDAGLSSGKGLTYTWDFGDGSKSNGAKIDHLFGTAKGDSGTQSFQVKLTVSNLDGCTDEIIKTVTVNKIPDATLGNSASNAELTEFNGLGTFRKCLKLDNYTFTFINKSRTTSTNTRYQIIWGDSSPDFLSSDWAFNDSVKHPFVLGNTVITFQVTNGVTGCVSETKYNVFIGSNSEGSISLSSTSGNSGCIGSTLEFPLSNYENNAPGTWYYIYVNDGPPFPNPLDSFTTKQAVYKHTFVSSSCGKEYENYKNSFYIKLIVQNACNLFPAGNSAYPIYISDTPRAKMYADTVACINTSTVVSDISFYGSTLNPADNQLDCSNSGKRLWIISNSSDVIPETGSSLGSYNGNFFDWNNWTSGSQSLNLTFQKAGTYTIKLYISNNNSCKKIDSTAWIICVREVPKSTIIFDTPDSCTSAIIKFKTALQNSCAGNNYLWNVVSSDSANCSPSNAYTFLEGTSATTDSAMVKFTGAGRYRVVLSAMARASSSCPVGKDTGIVTIKGRPLVNLNTLTSVCANDSISPTAKISDCYSGEALTYAWKFTGGLPDSSADATPKDIVYSLNGTKTVSLSVSNSCGTTTDTQNFEVVSNPVADAGPETLIMCSGEQKSIGKNTGNYTYDWLPKAGLSFYNTAEPVITHVNNSMVNDTLVFFLTVSGGVNCKDYDTVTVIVKPSPVLVVSPANKTICEGAPVELLASGAEAYTWSPALYLNSTTGSRVLATPPSSQTYTVSGYFNNNCVSTSRVEITVLAKPVADAGDNILEMCSGSSIPLGVRTGNYQYQWSPVNGLADPMSAPTSLKLFNNEIINDTLTYYLTVTEGDCYNADSIKIVVKRSPDIIVNPDKPSLCLGDSILLVASGADSYLWRPSSYLNRTDKDSVISKALATTIYTVTGSLGNGCSTNKSDTIVVNAPAKAEFAPNGTYVDCAGYNLKNVIKVTAYPDRNAEYKWYKNGELFFTSTSPAPPDYSLNTEGSSVNIHMIATSLTDCKADTTMPVTFKTIAGTQASFTKDKAGGCEPRSVVFTNISNVLDTSVTFTWDFGIDDLVSDAAQPADTIVYDSGPQSRDTTYYIKLIASNRCARDSAIDSIHILPKPVARFGTFDSTIGCSPYKITFNNRSTGNPVSYIWDFDDGPVLTTLQDTAVSHKYTSPFLDTFKVKLIAVNGCGRDTLPLDIVVAPNSIEPKINVSGSELFGCQPHSVTFNNSTVGAITAQWDFNDGSGIRLPGNQVVVTHKYEAAGTYHIKVYFKNGCSEAVDSQRVVVYNRPDANFSVIRPPNNVTCAGDSVRILVTGQSGDLNKLFWGDEGDLFYTTGKTSHLYQSNGIYTVKLVSERINDNSQSVCSDTALQIVKIGAKPVTTKAAVDNTISCFNKDAQLSVSGGVSYVWQPALYLSPNNTVGNPVATPSVSTTYTVDIYGASGCVIEDSVKVIVDYSQSSTAILLPNSFTPNDDGKNDCFGFIKRGLIDQDNFTFDIYNRRGQNVFHSTDPNACWNGTFKGVPQAMDVYVYTYTLRSVCISGKQIKEKGIVTLIR